MCHSQNLASLCDLNVIHEKHKGPLSKRDQFSQSQQCGCNIGILLVICFFQANDESDAGSELLHNIKLVMCVKIEQNK